MSYRRKSLLLDKYLLPVNVRGCLCNARNIGCEYLLQNKLIFHYHFQFQIDDLQKYCKTHLFLFIILYIRSIGKKIGINIFLLVDFIQMSKLLHYTKF